MSFSLGAAAIFVALAAARIGGLVADRLRQPRVLGELAAGLLLGNLTLLGASAFDFLKTDRALDFAAQVAVILLLFHASVESTIGDMKKLGAGAFVAAVCGVVGSFAAGWLATLLLLPSATTFTRAFIGASLTATSVGVTARVLRDLGQARNRSSHFVLAAAVIDDLIGLIILAVMTATGAIPIVVAKAAVFLVGGLAIGMLISPRLLSLASRSMSIVLLAAALAFCFAMAWLAHLSGLAPIVGAFAAGLAIEEWHYQDFIDRREKTLDDLITPLASWVVPIFFVVIGIRTNLAGVARPAVIGLAAALTAAAIAGKQLCALGASVAGKGIDRGIVALGMIPRGEVTLIYASLGTGLVTAGSPVVGPDTFLALVLVVIATTIVTPLALKWRVSTARRPSSAS